MQHALGISHTRSVASIAALMTHFESELMHASVNRSLWPWKCLTCTAQQRSYYFSVDAPGWSAENVVKLQ
jgi:hypothetical protein